ncbi:MAG TPA: PilZ domain-containing protein [Polyangia bacterium]|jgi:hypothetical protein
MADGQRKTHFRGKDRRGRRIPVTYRVLGDGETGPALPALTRNIGVGGAFIETPDPAPPGSALRVTLTLETGQAVEVAAEVRWIADGDFDDVHGMGVRFSGLGPQELRALNDYFATLPQAADLDELV